MRPRVRILYDIHPHTVGGTEQFLGRLLPHLSKSRFEPIVVSSRRGPPLRLLHSRGVRTAVVAGFFAERGSARLAQLMKRLGIGLVQSNYYSAQLAVAAGMLGLPHVWRPGGHITYGSGGVSRPEAASLLRMMRLLSDAIVCNSRYVASQFGLRTGRPRIEVIPNGVDVLPRSRPLPDGGRPWRIGMIAHFTAQKRHDDFIRAAQLMRRAGDHATFAIFGNAYSQAGSSAYAARIRRKAARLVDDGTLTLARFDHRAVADALATCDVLVQPSVGESFSNAVLEAMSAGVPVVAARSGGTPEIVVHQSTGLLVTACSPSSIARALRSLMSDPLRVTRMGRAARRRARTEFSMARCAGRYQRVYDRVLALS